MIINPSRDPNELYPSNLILKSLSTSTSVPSSYIVPAGKILLLHSISCGIFAPNGSVVGSTNPNANNYSRTRFNGTCLPVPSGSGYLVIYDRMGLMADDNATINQFIYSPTQDFMPRLSNQFVNSLMEFTQNGTPTRLVMDRDFLFTPAPEGSAIDVVFGSLNFIASLHDVG